MHGLNLMTCNPEKMDLDDAYKKNLKNEYKRVLFWAKRHKDFNKGDIEKRIEYIYKKDPMFIYNKGSDIVKKFYKLYGEVRSEFHKIKGFTHFKLIKGIVLLAEVDAEHDIYDLLLNFYIKRFPEFVICIKKNNKIYFGTGKKDIKFRFARYKDKFYTIDYNDFENLIKYIEYNVDKMIDLGKFKEEYWRKYYDSQYIKARKNIKLAKSILPKKYKNKIDLDFEFEKLELETKSTSQKKITDFLD